MSTPLRRRLDRRIVDLLEEFDVSWEVRRGSKHNHLLVDGKMVAVLPRSRRDAGMTQKNVLAAILRAVKK